MQNRYRRDGVAVFFVPGVDECGFVACCDQFVAYQLEFGGKDVGWDWTVAVFLSEEYLSHKVLLTSLRLTFVTNVLF